MIIACPPNQYTQILAGGDKGLLEFRGNVSVITSATQPAATDPPEARFDTGDTFSSSTTDPIWCKPLGVFPVNVGVALDV